MLVCERFLLPPLQYIRIRTLSMYTTVRNIRNRMNAVILQWKRVVCRPFDPPRRPFRIPSAWQCSLQQRFRNRPHTSHNPLCSRQWLWA